MAPVPGTLRFASVKDFGASRMAMHNIHGNGNPDVQQMLALVKHLDLESLRTPTCLNVGCPKLGKALA